ncbi:C40 family peptidase [Uliginosibacterium sp. H1]|uniref:C40 family peptidase n=1 Tax=Uliginosibacterium sp. H1 TaxID=3114757 RepID=UPI002E190004|nr:C40 family peptidase [Uliginosibacterium sp. H1]
MARPPFSRVAALAFVFLLSACGTAPKTSTPSSPAPGVRLDSFRLHDTADANEIVLYALGLLDTGYQFGGRNPEAGLDCSGMVSYVVEQVTKRRLPHNAAQIASLTRTIQRNELRPADLVFFNTSGKPYSHMGIYLGDGKFVHAPSTRGKVRVERIDMAYWNSRFTGARSLF